MCTTLEAEVEPTAAGRATTTTASWSSARSGAARPTRCSSSPAPHEAHLQRRRARPTWSAVGPGRAATSSRRLRTLLGDVSYNLVFHTAPHRHEGEFHWHVHVLPKLTSVGRLRAGHRACSSTSSPPESAAAAPHVGATVGLVAVRGRGSRSRRSSTRRPPGVGGASSTSTATSTGWPTPTAIRFTTEQHARAWARASTATPRSGRCSSSTTWRSPSGSPSAPMGVRHTGLVTGTGASRSSPPCRAAAPVHVERGARVPVVAGRTRRWCVGGGRAAPGLAPQPRQPEAPHRGKPLAANSCRRVHRALTPTGFPGAHVSAGAEGCARAPTPRPERTCRSVHTSARSAQDCPGAERERRRGRRQRRGGARLGRSAAEAMPSHQPGTPRSATARPSSWPSRRAGLRPSASRMS